MKRKTMKTPATYTTKNDGQEYMRVRPYIDVRQDPDGDDKTLEFKRGVAMREYEKRKADKIARMKAAAETKLFIAA